MNLHPHQGFAHDRHIQVEFELDNHWVETAVIAVAAHAIVLNPAAQRLDRDFEAALEQ